MAGKTKAKDISVEEFLAAKDKEALISELPFEAGLHLLEELVQRVESSSLPLDESLSAFESGSALIEKLQGILQAAEGRIREVGKEK